MAKTKFNYLSSNRKRLHAVFYILKDRKILDVVLKYLKYCTDQDFIDAITFLAENRYFHLEENHDIYFHALSNRASTIYVDYITFKTCGEILTLKKQDYYQLIKEFIYDEIVDFIREQKEESISKYDLIVNVRNVINDLERDFNLIDGRNKSSSFCLNNPDDVENKLINVVKNNITPSTYRTFNYLTNGGFKRGTLNILMGGTGSHKTTYLCNLALSQWLNGYNVVYVTLEIYGEEILKRLIANVTETKINEIDFLIKNDKKFLNNAKNIFVNKNNTFKIYELPSGTTTNNEIQKIIEDEFINGNKIDVLVIDYINLLTTVQNDGNSFKILKDVAEGLRVIARINDLVVITATQINRLGLNSDKPTLKDISESYGMATYADFIAAISYNRQTPNSIALVPLKNRYGHLVDVKIPMEIKGEYMKIYDYISTENFKSFYNVNTDIVDKIVKDSLNEIKSLCVKNEDACFGEMINEKNEKEFIECMKKDTNNSFQDEYIENLKENVEDKETDCIEYYESEEVDVVTEDFENESEDVDVVTEDFENESEDVDVVTEDFEISQFNNLLGILIKVINRFDENINKFIEVSKEGGFNSPYLNRIKLGLSNVFDLLVDGKINNKEDIECFVDVMSDFINEIQESLTFIIDKKEWVSFKERKFDNFCFYQIHSAYDYFVNSMKIMGYPIKTKKYFFTTLTNNYDSSKKIIKFNDLSNRERVIYVYNNFYESNLTLDKSIKSNIKAIYKYLYLEQSDINLFNDLDNYLEHDYNLMVNKLTENNLIQFYKNIEGKLNEILFTDNFWSCLVNWIRLEIVHNNKSYIDFNNPTPFSKVLYQFIEHTVNKTIFKDHLNKYDDLKDPIEEIKSKKINKSKPKGFKD